MPEEPFDELESLAEAWRSIDPTAAEGGARRGPERDLEQPDEATRAVLEWMAAAWQRAEAPRLAPDLKLAPDPELTRDPELPERRLVPARRPRLVRALLPLAALAAALALAWLLPGLLREAAPVDSGTRTGAVNDAELPRDAEGGSVSQPTDERQVGEPEREGTSHDREDPVRNSPDREDPIRNNPDREDPTRLVSVDSDRMEMVSGGVRLVLLTQG